MHLAIVNRWRPSRLLCAAFLATQFVSLLAQDARALDIAAGLGAVEQGDDRGQSAAIIHLGMQNQWYSRVYVWGRSFGPVTETNGILAAAKQTGVFGSKSIFASAGLSLMANQTAITYKDAPSENTSYTNTNVGLILGLRYSIVSTKTISLSASWDSHLYAAGDAVILLVTGRKQILGLTAGLSL